MTTPTHLSQRMVDESAASTRAPYRADESLGWVDFAAVMIFAVALFNAVYGIAAVVEDDDLRADRLLFGDLAMWGAILLAIAAVQALIAWLIRRRNTAGMVLGIALAGLNAFATLLAVDAYPIWSMLVVAVDLLVIYALTVHGLGGGD